MLKYHNMYITLNETRDSAAQVDGLPEVRRHVARDVRGDPGPRDAWRAVWHVASVTRLPRDVGRGHGVWGQVIIHILGPGARPGVSGPGERVPVRPLEVPGNGDPSDQRLMISCQMRGSNHGKWPV